MANKLTTMLQIRRILQLRSQGKSNRDIARELHKSRNTVNEYMQRIDETGLEIQQLLDMADDEVALLIYSATAQVSVDWRHNDLLNKLQYLGDELRKPHTTRRILWEEYRAQVPDGYGYTQFCEYLKRFLETQKAVMHFEHEPAASMMFDFAGDKVHLVDKDTGEITKHPVLVCVFPFSAFTYVEVLQSARRELLLKALNNAFSHSGGVPMSAKTDNMKQIVKKTNRYEPGFDELAEQWSAHYGCTMMATRVRKPRDKASVESHVNVVYNRIYAPLRNKVLHSIDHANEAFWEQMDKLNACNFQRCDYSRRDRFILHEKPLLLPLPSEPFTPKTKVNAKVQRNYCVTLGQDWHHYSVPFRHISKTVQIVYDTQDVEI
jgi:transposase